MGDLSFYKCSRTAVFKISLVFTTFEGHANFDYSLNQRRAVYVIRIFTFSHKALYWDPNMLGLQ